jgi:hypothetical protein
VGNSLGGNNRFAKFRSAGKSTSELTAQPIKLMAHMRDKADAIQPNLVLNTNAVDTASITCLNSKWFAPAKLLIYAYADICCARFHAPY